MKNGNLPKTGSVVIIVLALSGLPAFALPTLQNGDFSEPNLAGWTVVSDPVIDLNGVALFQQDLDESSSALGQAFTFPTGARTLSFDIVMTSVKGGETDSFTASLYDNDTGLPLISNEPGIDEFFYIDSGYLDDPTDPNVMKTVGAFDSKTVTLDVSGFKANQDAYLLFNLYTEDEGLVTTIELDNVNISLIPAPGALVLGGIGLGCVTWLRRRRTL